jgi:dephospho-CoA kinase
MLRVGLTGSIAVGKSFVAAILAELGCRIVDADHLARKVVEPGTPGLVALVETFGTTILNSDGSLNRERLGAIVFSNEEKRLLLNSILHPLIIETQNQILREWEEEDPEGIGVIDAALMIESGGYNRMDKLIVVHCRPEIQLERLINRNKLSVDEATRRISSQMPQEEKKRYADYLIDTSNGFQDTREQVQIVYKKLQSLAKEIKR